MIDQVLAGSGAFWLTMAGLVANALLIFYVGYIWGKR